jgi:hypothetical protein
MTHNPSRARQSGITEEKLTTEGMDAAWGSDTSTLLWSSSAISTPPRRRLPDPVTHPVVPEGNRLDSAPGERKAGKAMYHVVREAPLLRAGVVQLPSSDSALPKSTHSCQCTRRLDKTARNRKITSTEMAKRPQEPEAPPATRLLIPSPLSPRINP